MKKKEFKKKMVKWDWSETSLDELDLIFNKQIWINKQK